MSLWDINEVASILPLRELKPVGWPCGVPDFNGRHEFLGVIANAIVDLKQSAILKSSAFHVQALRLLCLQPQLVTLKQPLDIGSFRARPELYHGKVPGHLPAGSRQRTAHGIPGAPHIPRRIQLNQSLFVGHLILNQSSGSI